MIGNDIVDISLARQQSNWQRSRWLQKIFIEEELHYIFRSEDPERLVWSFWSRKEAAYKAHQQRFSLPRKLNPKDFKCTTTGKVHIENYSYLTITTHTQKYIYSIASVPVMHVKTQILNNNIHLKTTVLKTFLAKHIDKKPELFTLGKDSNGIPWIAYNERKLASPVSFTHHGHYAAFAIGPISV